MSLSETQISEKAIPNECIRFFDSAQEIANACREDTRRFLISIKEVLISLNDPTVDTSYTDITNFRNAFCSLLPAAPVSSAFLSKFIGAGQKYLERKILAENLSALVDFLDPKTPVGKAFADFERVKNAQSDRRLAAALIGESLKKDIFNIWMCEEITDPSIKPAIASAMKRTITKTDFSAYEDLKEKDVFFLVGQAQKYGISADRAVRKAMSRCAGNVWKKTIENYFGQLDKDNKDKMGGQIYRNLTFADTLALMAVIAACDEKPVKFKENYWFFSKTDGVAGNWLPKQDVAILPLALFANNRKIRNKLLTRFKTEVGFFTLSEISEMLTDLTNRKKQYKKAKMGRPDNTWRQWPYAPVFELVPQKTMLHHFGSVDSILNSARKLKEPQDILD